MSDERHENRSFGSEEMASLPSPQGQAPKLPRRKRRERDARLESTRFNLLAWIRGRRLEMAAVVIALLISNFFALQLWHFEGRFSRGREVKWWLPFWQTLENVELGLYDRRFTLRGPMVPRSMEKIAIVGIDQTSLNVLGTWPWPREWHAELIRRLKKAGARAIVLDIDFSDKRDIESDAALAQAISEAGNVLLPSFDVIEAGGQDVQARNFLNTPLTQTDYDIWYRTNRKNIERNPQKKRAYEVFKSLGFDEQTPDLAIAYVPHDLDDAVRRYPFRGEFNNHSVRIGGLGVLAAGVQQNLMDGGSNEKYEAALKHGAWPTLQGTSAQVPLDINLPPLPNSPVYFTTPIHWWGPPGTFSTFPYADVKGLWEVNAQGQRVFSGYDDAGMRARFKDRVVFVGATAHILKDTFKMPLFERKTDLAETKIPGVEVHATVAAMLFDGAYIYSMPPHLTTAMVYALTLITCLWTVLLRNWVNGLARSMQAKVSKVGIGWWLHSWLWFAVYGALVSLPLTLLWQGAKWLFVSRNLWIIATYPGASAALSCAFVLILLYSAETVERRKTIAQLGAYMAPEVRDEILAQPENQYVRPRRVVATMLFTDLEGFTSYSESHEPEEVVEALNDYLDRMVAIVRAHGGNVDKYIGDAIMAFFGLPIPRYDHAAQALLCAIAMQEECARFREETGVEFYMRIGVHTGEMIAGSIGAETAGHFNYTTLGDTVNLASRLEGKNKDFGSWIMCSAATFDAAGGIVEAESASTSIKGKSQDVEVFIVHGLHGLPEQDKHWGRQLPSHVAGALTENEGTPADGAGAEFPALPSPARALEEGKKL